MIAPTCSRCDAILSNGECLRCALELAIPPAETNSMDPIRIGDYRVLGRLGKGGMGVVYEAEGSHPQRRVAIKLLRTSLSDTFHARFVAEYEVLAHLDHPCIAQVIEAGVASVRYSNGDERDVPFYVMPRIHGTPITDACDAAGLDSRARIELMLRVVGAMHHAHQRGVIHRDLKPANILVDSDGTPKVLDFGIARIRRSDQTTSLHTTAGEVFGTAPYMSPEQLLGSPEAIDVRSEVYSLGVLIYELLTGQLPYETGGSSIEAIARRLKQQDHVPPSVHDPYCRGDLDAIIECCLQDNKEDRYESALALQEDLKRHLDGAVVKVRQASQAYVWKRQLRRYRKQVAQAAAVLLSLIVFAVVSWNLYLSASRAEKTAVEQLYESNLSQAKLAIASNEPTRQRQALAAIHSAAAIRSTAELASVAIAAMGLDGLELDLQIPDVEWSYPQPFARKFLVPASQGNTISIRDGGSDSTLARIDGPGNPWRAVSVDIHSDGTYAGINYVNERDGGWALHVWDLGTLKRLFVVPTHSAAHKFRENQLFTAYQGVQTWDLSTGDLASAFAEDRIIRDLSLNPVRPWIALVMDDRIEVWDIEHQTMIHEIRLQLQEDLLNRGGDLVVAFWDREGNRLAIGSGTGHVHVWDVVNGVLLQSLSKHGSLVWATMFGPGPLLISSAWDGTTRIWNLLTGLPAFTTFGHGSRPVAADAERIVLHQQGRINVYRYMKPLAKEVRYQSDSIQDIALSSDSRWMALAGSNTLTIENLQSHRRRVVLNSTTVDVDFSADGSRLFAAARNGLYCWAAEDSFAVVWHRNDGAGAGVAISPNNQILCGLLDRRLDGPVGHYTPAAHGLRLYNAETGDPISELAEVDGGIRPHFSPDGRYLAIGTWRGTSEIRDVSSLEVLRSVSGKHILAQFSPDARFYVESESRKGERVLRTDTWEVVSHYEVGNTLSSIGFGPSSDFMFVASLGTDEVQAVEVATGRVLARFPLEVSDVSALNVLADGTRLIVGTTNGVLSTWYLDRVADHLRDLGLANPLDLTSSQARSN